MSVKISALPAASAVTAGDLLPSTQTDVVTRKITFTQVMAGLSLVVGPASATDNAIVRFDSTTGKLVQDSNTTISDNGALSVTAATAATTPLTVKGAASQTGNLTEWQNSSGTAYLTVGPPTITGSSSTSNFLNLTATMPTTMTTTTNAIRFVITSAGSSSSTIQAMALDFNAGYTGDRLTTGLNIVNSVAGTGNDPFFFGLLRANFGFRGAATGTTTGTNVGGIGNARNGDKNYGILAEATIDKASATNVGICALALNTAATPIQIAGYFGLRTTEPTYGSSAALMCDNGSQTSDIFVARDNGTAKFTIADGGVVTFAAAMNKPIATITADPAPASAAQYTLLADASGGAFSVTLPAAASSTGRIYVIKKIDATGNAVTIDGNAAETIDGAATQAISVQWNSLTIQCNGTAWFII